MKVSSTRAKSADNLSASDKGKSIDLLASEKNTPTPSEELATPDPSNTHLRILDKRLEEHIKNPNSGRSWDALKSELASKNVF